VENITNRLIHAEEIISRVEHEVKDILHLDSNAERTINKHECNFQELWDTINKETKPKNLRTEKGAEI
jgi:hypothetical protein